MRFFNERVMVVRGWAVGGGEGGGGGGGGGVIEKYHFGIGFQIKLGVDWQGGKGSIFLL